MVALVVGAFGTQLPPETLAKLARKMGVTIVGHVVGKQLAKMLCVAVGTKSQKRSL